jgi:hypothetical protein
MWDIPVADIESLARWGLPVVGDGTKRGNVQLVGAIQTQEALELLVGDDPAYVLGSFWRCRIGALIGTGEVVGVSDDPVLGISRINSSVAAFVEIRGDGTRYGKS